MRIAICDDEKRICSILGEKVKEIYPDAEVIAYSSGEELLKTDMLPDILLLDIRMPGMNIMGSYLLLKKWSEVIFTVSTGHVL